MVESFGLIFTLETEPGVLPTDILFLLWLLFLPDTSCLFLHSPAAIRLLIIETYSRMSFVAKLRSQNGSDKKWFLLCQESPAWFSFSRDFPTLPACKVTFENSYCFSLQDTKPLGKLCDCRRTHGLSVLRCTPHKATALGAVLRAEWSLRGRDCPSCDHGSIT